MEREELEALQVSFALVSQLLYSEPAEQLVVSAVENDLFAEAPCGEGDPAVEQGLALMRAWCAEARPVLGDSGVLAARMADLRADWLWLIGGAGAPKAPSWAGYYLTANSQVLSEETLAVRRMYARHGFEVARKNTVPDDDLGTMLGFVAYLLGAELAAEQGSDPAAQARADQRELLVDRILPWICAWQYSMDKYAKTGFYRGVGHFVFGLLRVYAQRFGIAHNPSGEPAYWTASK